VTVHIVIGGELSATVNYERGYGRAFGLLVGLVSWLRFGGRACLHHCALRLVLWHKNFTPLNYVRFLDYL